MASNLRVDSIVPATGGSVSIGTATGGVTIPGDLGIAGALTYEDVTNVDSIGVITARTNINLGDSIIHIGDTNTKIRFPSADTITAETNSSERLRITSGGLVGIGSITPANQLDIQGGSHTKIHVGTTGTAHATGIQINHAKGAAALQEWQLQTDATSTANLIIRNATSGNTIQTFNTTGNITTPLQCGACVRMSAGTTSWPGNNSFENSGSLLAFDTEIYDIGGNYNTSTYAFTVPVDGRYLITYNVQLENITNAGWWYVYPVINANNSQTNGRGITYADYGMGSSSSSYFATTGSYIPLLQANDSVTLRARGTISANIKGNFESSWSIMLIG